MDGSEASHAGEGLWPEVGGESDGWGHPVSMRGEIERVLVYRREDDCGPEQGLGRKECPGLSLLFFVFSFSLFDF
jgi:hypothetical protein